MRLHVVYDDQGTILTAAQVPVEDQALPKPGEHAAELNGSGAQRLRRVRTTE
jgi:hypothetical protein